MRLANYAATLVLTLIAACSSGGTGNNEGTISLGLNPTSATVQQGGQAITAATLTRAGGFTGTVNLTVTGQHATMTATVTNVVTTGLVTTATVTIQTTGATPAGVYPMVLHGNGSGVAEALANYSLTVTAAPTPAYTLGLSAPALTILQGASTPTTTVNIGRTNFAGNITLSVDNLPTGVTAAFNPVNPQTGTSSVLTLTVAGNAPTGTFTNLLVRGQSTLLDVTVPLSLTITAPTPSFTLSLSSATLTIPQGSATPTTTVNINRTNFPGDVALSVLNLPTGVTAAFLPVNPQTGNSSVLTLTVAPGAPTGTFNTLAVQGVGTAGTVSTPLTLTISAGTPAGNFTLTTTPATSTSVTQGANTTVTVNINRTGGNTSDVALTATGTLPAGMTLAFLPTSTTGASSVLTITTTGATPTGATPIVIHGNTAGLGEQLANLTINVTAPGGGSSVSVSFVGCPAEDTPVWAASQNGGPATAWQVVTPVAGVYSFTINAGQGGFTYVTLDGGSSNVFAQFMTQAQFTAGVLRFCGAVPTNRTLTGSIAGMANNDLATVSFGGAVAFAPGALPNFTLNNAALGAHDLIIYTHPQAVVAASDRMAIYPAQNPASAFTPKNIQTDPEAFLPLAALIDILNFGAGETHTHSMNYYSGAACDFGILYSGMPVTGTQFNAYGAQANRMQTGDRHGLYVQGTTGTVGTYQYRSVWETFHDLVPHSVTMPAQVPLGTTTETGTSYSILRKQFTAPADYNVSFNWEYIQASAPKSAMVTASLEYFGGTSIDLKLGNYTGLPGWTNGWAPTAGLHADTYTTASGDNGTGPSCSSSTRRIVVAGRVGSF